MKFKHVNLTATVVVVMCLISVVTNAYAATYYVDADNGNDSNTGTSTSDAWKSLSKVEKATLNGGDIVRLKRGSVWREDLVLSKKGTSGQPITISDFGSGNLPQINGSNLLTNWVSNGGNVWYSTVSISPRQVFFDDMRGSGKSSALQLTGNGEWYYDSASKRLYVYATSDPSSAYSNPGVEVSIRNYNVQFNSASYLVIENLHLVKAHYNNVSFAGSSSYCSLRGCVVEQGNPTANSVAASIMMSSDSQNCEISGTRIGRRTGNDIPDQAYAAFNGIIIKGRDHSIFNNEVYHTAIENESANGFYTNGIKIDSAHGVTRVYGNTVYHTGSMGIAVRGKYVKGDVIRIYDNNTSYCGQSGISAYQTRGSDGVGGEGHIYQNNVSYCNRLADDVGGADNAGCGIHLNDAIQATVSSSEPFIKWYVYKNEVYSCRSEATIKAGDSGGIAIDYNANGAEVYHNIIHDNYGEGVYIWNADNCKVYGNVIWGNNAGILVSTRATDGETSNNNQIYNNLCYKNYNGPNGRDDYDCEILFGLRDKGTVVKNNILYSHPDGRCYWFFGNTTSATVENNVLYHPNNDRYIYTASDGYLSFSEWKAKGYDADSKYDEPEFENAAGFNFRPVGTSPVRDSGDVTSRTTDFDGNPIDSKPDIGPFEYQGGSSALPPSIQSVTISPSTGWVGIDDTVAITVTAANNESGLTASAAMINGKQVALNGQGDGRYTGTYTVQSGDTDGVNVNATGITLTGEDGTSAAASSSGSTLKVDGHRPSVANVTLTPSSGTVVAGGSVGISVMAANNETGLTPSTATINGKQIPLTESGGGIYAGTYTVNEGDASANNVNATDITLTDAAGNTSAKASSSGSTLQIDTTPPVPAPSIQSVTISPSTGWAGIDDTVTITVTAANNESGLTASVATFNGRQVTLNDQGDGRYIGTYTVQSGDPDGVNVEATGITLTGEGGTSAAVSSNGSTLKVDGYRPAVEGVTLSPSSGWLKAGSTVTITVNAANSETGLTPSTASINGKQVPLTESGGGDHTGTYTVSTGDAQGENIAAAGITLTDAAGNISNAATSGASALTVDTVAPIVSSVTISPNTGTVTPGDEVVIVATAKNAETGLSASQATINNRSVALIGQGNGTYRGVYTVSSSDPDGTNIEAENIRLTDAAGNVSLQASSSGSSLTVDTTPVQAPLSAPVIASVTISPDNGIVGIGDDIEIVVSAQNNETGLTASQATINGTQVTLSESGNGIYTGTYTVKESDPDGVNVEAYGITLTGEGGTSAPASSSGSSLSIDAHRPSVQSVSLTPSSGWLKAGDTVTITATASNNESGLSVSPVGINGIQIPMSDLGSGVYRGQYTVSSDDDQGTGLTATGVVFTDAAGNASAPGSSTNSTLRIDTIVPSVQSVTISPSTGLVQTGETVAVTVRAGNNETGLDASPATFNGRQVSLSDRGDGTYTGTYTVLSGDNAGTNVEAMNVTLTDDAGNVSSPASSTGSSLSIDPSPVNEPAAPPVVASVTINPSSGLAGIGDTVAITVRAENNETGLTPSQATFNGTQVTLNDQGDGRYTGTYIVQSGDADGVNVNATGITLTGPGGTSASASTSGSTLRIDAHAPVVSIVELTPSQGVLGTGDSVNVTVRTDPAESGLASSQASINNRVINLQDAGNGTYRGTYTVQAGDPQGQNLIAQNITLSDDAGNTSSSASSSVSSLSVDTVAPVISSVTLSPEEGQVVAGDQVTVRVTTNPAETGLNGSVIINGRTLTLEDRQDGTYRGIYSVTADVDALTGVQAKSAQLTDSAGNVSEPANSSMTSLSIVPDGSNAELPKIASVEISPNRGWVTTGSTVQITVKSETIESGMSASQAAINGELVPLEPLVIQSDAYHVTEVPGTFVGQYVVEADDAQGKNIEAENITITNADGITSLPASSTGSTLKVDTVKPTIKKVKLDPMVSKSVAAGDAVLITVTAENNETGLLPSDAIIHEDTIPLADRGDGTYTGIYTVVVDNDMDYLLEVQDVTLTDPAGNVSDPASSLGSEMIIDIPVTVDRTDFNNDGTVSLGDLTVMGRSWTHNRGSEKFDARLDLNRDGTIGLGDLVLLARYWGQTYQAPAKLAKTAPIETGSAVLSARVMEISPEKYEIIFTCSDTNIEGISITLGVPESSTVDLNNIEGLSGINITREIEPGIIEINSYYSEGQFSGAISVPVIVEGSDGGSVTVLSSLVAEVGGALYVPSYGGALPDIMLAPSAENPVLAQAGETWIDIRVQAFQYGDYTLTIQPLNGNDEPVAVNMTSETFRISSLKPGNHYQLTINDSQGNVVGSTSVTTLAAFIDDDLDAGDPYILRDEDGLFIADNDGQIIFAWASWKSKGAALYEVTVNDPRQSTVTLVEETSVSIQGANGSYYSVTVIPRDHSGEALGRIESRAILCSADDIETVEEVVIR